VKKITFAAMGAVMLATVSVAWAEDRAVAEAKKSLTQLQEDFRNLKSASITGVRGCLARRIGLTGHYSGDRRRTGVESGGWRMSEVWAAPNLNCRKKPAGGKMGA
jgi:hypothetical protein